MNEKSSKSNHDHSVLLYSSKRAVCATSAPKAPPKAENTLAPQRALRLEGSGSSKL